MIKTSQIDVCQYFLEIAGTEQDGEIIKQLLCELTYFTPISSFNYLDKDQVQAISSLDVQEFLLENDFRHVIEDCELFIKRYDINLDGKLQFGEFLQAIITQNNQKLKLDIISRKPDNYLRSTRQIPHDVQFALAKFIDMEIKSIKQREKQKKQLFRLHDYSIPILFDILDVEQKQYIDKNDIDVFLRKNGYKLYETELQYIYRHLDFDCDGVISYSDFVSSLDILSNEKLPYSVNRSSSKSKLYQSKIETPNQKKISPTKGILKTSENILKSNSKKKQVKIDQRQRANTEFNQNKQNNSVNQNDQIFSQIKRHERYDRDLQKERSLQNLLKQNFIAQSGGSNKKQQQNNYKNAFFSPFKKNTESKYNNFMDNITPKKNKETIKKRINLSMQKQTKEKQNSEQKYQNLKASLRHKIASMRTKNGVDVNASLNINNTQQKKAKQIPQSYSKTAIQNGEKKVERPKSSSIIKQNQNNSGRQKIKIQNDHDQPTKFYVERKNLINLQLIELIQFIIQYEKKIERAKEDLASRSDFNLMDCFRYIDQDGTAKVSSLMLEDFFKEIQINVQIEDIFLFIRRFDIDNDGQLKFSDFAEAIIPMKENFADLMKQRQPQYPNIHQISIRELYSKQTFEALRNLFKKYLECEHEIEKLRKQFQSKVHTNYHDAFTLLDVFDDTFITQKELQIFFQRNGQVILNNDLDYFISRFDQDKDGKISFGEFVQELAPRSQI